MVYYMHSFGHFFVDGIGFSSLKNCCQWKLIKLHEIWFEFYSQHSTIHIFTNNTICGKKKQNCK